MKLSYVLALAGAAFAAPAVVTETTVVWVLPDAEPTSSSVAPKPKLGSVIEVVVSELVKVAGDNTETSRTTYTRTVDLASTAASAASTSSVATGETKGSATVSTTLAAVSTVAPTSSTTQASTRATTTLTPTTSSTQAQAQQKATSTTSTQAAATTTKSSETDSADSSFASAILNAHNEKRALHGVSDLTWSSELAAYAQAYADNYDCSGVLTHSGGKYGENLGLGYTTTGVVDAWYNEISDYDWNNPVASHFTQVVWKSTTQLGCGYKQCNNIWGQYTICSYNPAGNIAGQYAANVLPVV